MKVAAGIALHYGAEYLEYAMKSVSRDVDLYIVMYNDKPCHGTIVDIPKPKGEEQSTLLDIASEIAKINKRELIIQYGSWKTEGEQRDAMESLARKEEVEALIILDSDEVWHDRTIMYLYKSLPLILNDTRRIREYRIPMVHLWQGFNMVCRDQLQPVRLVLPYHPKGGETGYLALERNPPIFHFGYAISDELMEYKWKIHGHIAELRPNWMKEKWLARATQDVHPTNLNFWNAEPIDKLKLPGIMTLHRRFNEG